MELVLKNIFVYSVLLFVFISVLFFCLAIKVYFSEKYKNIKHIRWKSIENELPPANVDCFWYDMMMDKQQIFSLENPEGHDLDYTHWAMVPDPPTYTKKEKVKRDKEFNKIRKKFL